MPPLFGSSPKPMPPNPDRCSRWAPGVKCAQRREAQECGEFFYSFHHHGWIWGEDRMISRVLRDEHKQPFVWTFCPWCQGALPDIEAVMDGLKGQSDGDDGN